MDAAGNFGALIIHLPRPWSTVRLVQELRDALLQCSTFCLRHGDPAGQALLLRCAGMLDEAVRQHTEYVRQKAGELEDD